MPGLRVPSIIPISRLGLRWPQCWSPACMQPATTIAATCGRNHPCVRPRRRNRRIWPGRGNPLGCGSPLGHGNPLGCGNPLGHGNPPGRGGRENRVLRRRDGSDRRRRRKRGAQRRDRPSRNPANNRNLANPRHSRRRWPRYNRNPGNPGKGCSPAGRPVGPGLVEIRAIRSGAVVGRRAPMELPTAPKRFPHGPRSARSMRRRGRGRRSPKETCASRFP